MAFQIDSAHFPFVNLNENELNDILNTDEKLAFDVYNDMDFAKCFDNEQNDNFEFDPMSNQTNRNSYVSSY